jgi:hypothetical protein
VHLKPYDMAKPSTAPLQFYDRRRAIIPFFIYDIFNNTCSFWGIIHTSAVTSDVDVDVDVERSDQDSSTGDVIQAGVHKVRRGRPISL